MKYIYIYIYHSLKCGERYMTEVPIAVMNENKTLLPVSLRHFWEKIIKMEIDKLQVGLAPDPVNKRTGFG